MRTLLFVVLIVELFLLIMETRGDFANGILFYISGQLNIFVLGLFLLLFSTTYFWGRSAGKEILIDGRNYLVIGIKYSLLETAVVLGYILILYMVSNTNRSIWQALLQVIARISIPLMGIWLWSVWRIKLRSSDKDFIEPL